MKTVNQILTLMLVLGLHARSVYAANGRDIAKAPPAEAAGMPVITQAWVRATVPGQPVGAAYMTIASVRDVRLTHVETDAAMHVQVHSMHMHDGVMQMRELGGVDIPAGKSVQLAPGGSHLMLLGLKKPLKAGEAIPMKMTFVHANKKETTLVITLPIRPIGQ